MSKQYEIPTEGFQSWLKAELERRLGRNDVSVHPEKDTPYLNRVSIGEGNSILFCRDDLRFSDNQDALLSGLAIELLKRETHV